MRAAIDGVDVVGKAENLLVVAVVVLNRDFDCHAVALGFHVDRLVVQYVLAVVQMLDEFCDAAGVMELSCFGFAGLWIGTRSSVSVICRPLFRKAISRSRWDSLSKLYSVAVKMFLSGRK